MSRDNIAQGFEKEHIYVVEIDVPRCVNTFQSSPCVGGTWRVTTAFVGVDDFNVGDEIEGVTSGAVATILEISGSSPNYTFVYRITNGVQFTASEDINNNTATGEAILNAGTAASESTGDEKCYNTRTTCTDLTNYKEVIDTGAITINANATSGTFTRTSGSFLTDGFEEGQIITVTGYTNDGNNSQFEIDSVTATVITVVNSYGMVTESGGGDEQITTPNNYTYYHCTSRSPHPQGMNNYAPCVRNVSIAPARIDPKGGIGARTSASIQLDDFASSDRYDIDPYLSDRSFDPRTKGSYWTKWRARNANYENYTARVRSGYIVDNEYDTTNFQTRHYVVNSMTATNGQAEFRLKDPIQLVSNKKALAPRPSNGVLNAAITAGSSSLTLSPSGIGNAEYPASGWVKISDEVMSFTRSGDVLTITRGQFNTTAAAHDTDDTVQLCLRYTGQPMNEVQADLCITYAEIPAIYIPQGAWESEVDTYLPGNPDALITDPTPVNKLIGELCEQWPHKLFWNDRSRQIEMVAIKEPPTLTSALNEDDDLLSFSVNDKPEMQLSTVFVYYGQLDPTKKLDETNNYKVTYGRVNTDAIARYNSNNSKVIYSRWILDSAGSIARGLAGLLGRRFGITPRMCNFTLSDKNTNIWVGDIKNINHFDMTDFNGDPEDTRFEIISAKESDHYEYTGLEFNFDALLDNDVVPGVDIVDIPDDDFDYNMRTAYEAIYGTPTASTVAKFIVYSGAVVGARSTGTPALQTGSWPAGATITLQVNSGGYVVGAGGDGSSSTGFAGSDGGDAISLAYDLELINNGIIGGGGGGGGAAGADGHTAAGGGGAGQNRSTDITPPDSTTRGGLAGSNDATGSGTVTNSTSASNGALESRGSRGRINYTIAGEPFFVAGGLGGDLGDAGETKDSAGGAAGKAVDLNGNTLTQTVGGDIRGTIS